MQLYAFPKFLIRGGNFITILQFIKVDGLETNRYRSPNPTAFPPIFPPSYPKKTETKFF